MKRENIVACARTYLGTPFAHQGRIRGMALDCVGLVICVGNDLSLPVPNYANYGMQAVDDTVLKRCKEHLQEVPVEQMQPGDILCFRCEHLACHVGIATELMGNPGIIHAYSPNKKVVEHNLDFKWRRRIAGVFRFPNVEDANG
jgi:NlpC/P60 family putative phage cell wall peptidase